MKRLNEREETTIRKEKPTHWFVKSYSFIHSLNNNLCMLKFHS